MKPRILVFLHYYLPGVRSGGPLQSIRYLTEALGDEFSFDIVTLDRDKGDISAYPGIVPNEWNTVGRARVLYLSPDRLGIYSLLRLLSSEEADCLYVNSFFARQFSMVPMLGWLLGTNAQRAVVLAPRGEFSLGAVGLKARRKRLFIGIAGLLPSYRRVVWHASTVSERADIHREFGTEAKVRVAMEIAAPGSPVSACEMRTDKIPGSLRVVFLSRIVEKKNLLGALHALSGVIGDVEFNVYGPAEDPVYLSKCRQAIAQLPGNISVTVRPEVANAQVPAIFAAHHVFLFPTLGENYGYVIGEALAAGCPVILSDQTPWQGLQGAGAGWNIPLGQPEIFRMAVQRYVDMTLGEFQEASAAARKFAVDFSRRSDVVAENRSLFRAVACG